MEESNSRNALQVTSQSENAATAGTATDCFQDDTVLHKKVVLGVCAMRKKVSIVYYQFLLKVVFSLVAL